MSVSSEITRITNDRNTIRNKLINFGLATSSDTLDTLSATISGIVNHGAPAAEVQEGTSYTILPGYYTGGSISGVAGGGNYTLQQKTGITPITTSQTISPDAGYYGLSSVTINAIPENYKDVSSVTATASDVLATKVIVTSSGNIAGTMVNNGAVSKTLDATTGNQSYTVPAGYHNGSGSVAITLQQTSVTPTESSQTITPDAGKVLSSVVVGAIPSNYADVTGTDAIASHLIEGETAVVDDGDGGATTITGTMPNNGGTGATLTVSTTSYSIPAGYTSGGTVSITTEAKTGITPTKATQTITPSSGKVLSSVTVNPIPAIYGDATDATATAANILVGTKAVIKSNGAASLTSGTMSNNSAVTATITGLGIVAGDTSYTIPAGYHNGSGTVSLTSDIEQALAAI